MNLCSKEIFFFFCQSVGRFQRLRWAFSGTLRLCLRGQIVHQIKMMNSLNHDDDDDDDDCSFDDFNWLSSSRMSPVVELE